MATTHIQTDLSSEKPVKTQRRYTVGYLPGRGDASTPSPVSYTHLTLPTSDLV